MFENRSNIWPLVGKGIVSVIQCFKINNTAAKRGNISKAATDLPKRELKYENVDKAQTAQKFDSKT